MLHLMLGGWMFYGSAEERPDHTCQVVLSFGKENLYFVGLRLGYLHLLTQAEVSAKLSKLGPEPFDNTLTPTTFRHLLMKRDGALKAKLTDQHLIAGIGNRYSDEICFAAGVLPLRSTHSLRPQEAETLYRAMQTTLRHAIEVGGYMATPFSINDHLTGRYADEFFVYNRGGEPCKVCTNPIVRTDYSGRKVFYCTRCQH